MIGKVNINGKAYDARTGKLIGEPTKKSAPIAKTRHAKNTRRQIKYGNAASRATYVKPVVVAKQTSKNIDGVIPTAATALNPISANRKKKPLTKKGKDSRKKVIRWLVVAIVIVAGFGLLALFYFPTFSVNFAASQAGINGASYPSFVVDGYFMDGGVQVESRKITINYRNIGGETYSISQQTSTWDSEGLLENYIKIEQLNYQILTQHGLTIFRLDDGAMWVSGGILFRITSGEQLSNDQVLSIIGGM